jgi:hypothetical protein
MKINSNNHTFNRNLKQRSNYDMFGDDFRESLHWGKLFVHLFGVYYSRYRIKCAFNHVELTDAFIDRYKVKPENIIRIQKAMTDDLFTPDPLRSEVLLILRKGLFVVMVHDYLEVLYSSHITEAERQEIVKIANDHKKKDPIVKKFHMIQNFMGSFDLAAFDVKPFDIDIDSHYNDDFAGIHQIICNSLSEKSRNGIVLLHGKYGSGKTYYLRHLLSTIERKFIYFPLNMIYSINSPEFVPFISEHPNSVLILEDCESLLVPRDNSHDNASALSNLLNMGDGLLSDALSINLICTFNAGLRRIDDAILRKGRLLARYEFKELETEKAQALALKIGKNITVEKPMTVADIYNCDDTSFENETPSPVGFRVNGNNR